LRRLGLIGSGLATAVLAGFLLGSCGGGDGSAVTTLTGVTATRPAATATRPSVTVPTRTAPTAPTPTEPATTAESPETTAPETTAPETTAPEPTTTAPPPTVTVTEPATTEAPPTEPATTEAPPTTTAEAAEPTSSEADDTPWGWIALAAALVAAALVGVLLWRRRRAGAETWAAQRGDLSRRSLVALDDVIRDGSVVTGRIQALAQEARSLESGAPDDAARAAAGQLRARLDELAATLEADRTLRLSSPPPSAEQLSYSTALIHQQVGQLQGVLRPPQDAGPPPAGP
jgi:MYXO-CTERM domain-containing protein